MKERGPWRGGWKESGTIISKWTLSKLSVKETDWIQLAEVGIL
jgi:hypothetical protein